ncbi:hypothetical protein ABTM81_19675, partial [Acinetobacter baumannii]
MATNSRKPIGRWVDETQALALVSVMKSGSQTGAVDLGGHAAPHNATSRMAARRICGQKSACPISRQSCHGHKHRFAGVDQLLER